MGIKRWLAGMLTGGNPAPQVYGDTGEALAPPGETSLARQDLNRRLDEYVLAGLGVTQNWLILWRDALNYTFNNQLYNFDESAWPEGWPRIQSNYIFPGFEQGKAILSQRRPQIIASPYEDGDVEGARFWQKVLQYQFTKELNMPLKSLAAYMDCAVYGYCVAKVIWEPQLAWDGQRAMDQNGNLLPPNWTGGPVVRLLHPAYFGADPEAEDIQEAAYVFSRRRVRVEWAKQRWPDHKMAIEAASRVSDTVDELWSRDAQDGPLWYSDQPGPGLPGPVEGRLASMMGWSQRQGAKRFDGSTGMVRPTYVTVEEVYWRDDTARPNWDNEDVPKEELLARGEVVYDGDVPREPKSGQILTAQN